MSILRPLLAELLARPEASRRPTDLRGRRVAFAVVAVLGLAYGLLATQFARIQVVQGEVWREKADRQQLPMRTVPAYRGDIRTADGAVLARSVRMRSAFAEPRRMGTMVRNRDKGTYFEPPTTEQLWSAAHRLGTALGYSRDEQIDLLRRLENPKTQGFCWIKRRLTDDEAARVAAAEVPGVSFKTEYARVYPAGTLAAHVLGFTRLDGEGDLEGRSGAEQAFDAALRGKDGRREILRDNNGRVILTEDLLVTPPEDGATVVLTIDSQIQAIVEAAMEKGASIWNPEGIADVVLDPSDGRLLALASWPTDDPAKLTTLDPRAIRCRPLQDPYEPGSTIKPIIAAAAVEARAIGPNQVIDCTGPFAFAGHLVKDVHPNGRLPFRGVISHSSNVGMVKIAAALGSKGIAEALARSGFGRRTGIGLVLEDSGLSRRAEELKPHTIRSVAQGYGLMVTPLQLASAFSALAAQGMRYEPQLIESIVSGRGETVRSFEKKPAGRLLDADVCERVMVPALREVVEDGTATSVQLSKWSAAGKTGTAEKIIGGRYARNRYRASFVGFAPAEAPRMLVLVMVDDPRSPDGRRPFGGTVAGPIVKEIFEGSLPYLRVPPSPKEPEAAGTR